MLYIAKRRKFIFVPLLVTSGFRLLKNLKPILRFIDGSAI
jgi:hypothetical protein